METNLQKQIMFWDTTKYPAEYPQKIKKIYFKESITNRKPFTKWIGKISKNFPNDIYLVFHFLGEIGKDTKQGKITRFVIRGDKIIEENEIIKDLDNGVHEITSTGKDIIILQTYYQNIIRYQLDDKYYPILSS